MLTLVAADVLGVAPESVEIRFGDTSLPEAGMTAGSSSTMGVGSAVHAAATELRDKLAATGHGAPADLLDAAGVDSLEVEARWDPAESGAGLSIHTYGAVFAEVRVDADLGLVRMTRCVGVYGAANAVFHATGRRVRDLPITIEAMLD